MFDLSRKNCEVYLEEYFNSVDKEEYNNNKQEYRQYSEHFFLICSQWTKWALQSRCNRDINNRWVLFMSNLSVINVEV